MIPYSDVYLRLRNKSKIRAIKFSPDKRLICVQYDESTVVSFLQNDWNLTNTFGCAEENILNTV